MLKGPGKLPEAGYVSSGNLPVSRRTSPPLNHGVKYSGGRQEFSFASGIAQGIWGTVVPSEVQGRISPGPGLWERSLPEAEPVCEPNLITERSKFENVAQIT